MPVSQVAMMTMMLMMWSHKFFPCDQQEIDPKAYMETFLGLVKRGLAPQK